MTRYLADEGPLGSSLAGSPLLAQVVHVEQDLPYLIPASRLARPFGERDVKRHVKAFNELTRIMTAITMPKGGRQNADIPMLERCLTLAAITEPSDGSTPLLQQKTAQALKMTQSGKTTPEKWC